MSRILPAIAAAFLLVLVAGSATAGDEPAETLRRAHASRDAAAVAAAEEALVARGRDIVEEVRAAFEAERQFNVMVSLQYVLLAIEGKASARSVIDLMRETKDPSDKMRLAFILQKLHGEGDVAALEEALATEADPMIAKHIVRAMAASPGAGPVDTLIRVARSSPDRSLRIEALRAIEERATRSPEVVAEATKALVAIGMAELDPSIRSVAIRALASVGDREAAAFFQQVLEKDDRTNNRAEAAKFYARAGTDGDLPFLEATYERERVHYLKQKLAQAIDGIHGRAGREPPARAPIEVPVAREPEPSPVPTPAPGVEPASVRRLQPSTATSGPVRFPEVIAVDCPDDPAARSAFIRMSGHPASSFGQGDDLGRRPGFESYVGVRVRSIDARGVVLADSSGIEIRLEVRAPAAPAPASPAPPAEGPR